MERSEKLLGTLVKSFFMRLPIKMFERPNAESFQIESVYYFALLLDYKPYRTTKCSTPSSEIPQPKRKQNIDSIYRYFHKYTFNFHVRFHDSTLPNVYNNPFPFVII